MHYHRAVIEKLEQAKLDKLDSMAESRSKEAAKHVTRRNDKATKIEEEKRKVQEAEDARRMSI